jgi:DNA invertase Pin-like site-specific DNA recombinase
LHFITELQKSKVSFVIAEMPDATELTIHIYAALAQHERKLISQRTQEALAQLIAQGELLGNPCFKEGKQIPGSGDTTNANIARISKAEEFAEDIAEIIKEMKEQGGVKSLRDIATMLNAEGYRTARGKEWQATSINRIIKRTTLKRE